MSLDLKDIILEVQADFAEIVQAFQEDLAEPQMTDALAVKWMTTPPEQKEVIKQRLPKTYQAIMQKVTKR